MTVENFEQASPTDGWQEQPAGDWNYYRNGLLAGAVVFQESPSGRVWYSVSSAKSHGPEAGKLTECKRRLEALWK